jgi:hypothetical protein
VTAVMLVTEVIAPGLIVPLSVNLG